MDHLRGIASLQVPEDGSVVEEGQVDHVLALLKLRRVHPANLFLHMSHLFVANRNGELGREIRVFGADGSNFCSFEEQTLSVAAGLGVRNPNGLFWFVRLVLIFLLHVDGREKILAGVGVNRSFHKLDVPGHGGEARLPVEKAMEIQPSHPKYKIIGFLDVRLHLQVIAASPKAELQVGRAESSFITATCRRSLFHLPTSLSRTFFWGKCAFRPHLLLP